MDYYYNKLTKQNTTDYYNMIESEYKRLTSHIITFYTTLLERGVINGKRESLTAFVERLEILTKDKYPHKSNQHDEPISMLDALQWHCEKNQQTQKQRFDYKADRYVQSHS